MRAFLSRTGRLAALASLVMLSGAACGRLEDVLSPGKRVDAPPARVALAAKLPALSKGAVGVSVQLRVQAFYTRTDGTRVALGTQIVTLDDAPTQQVPITIDLSACLSDPQRAGDPAGGCAVTLEISLYEGERLVDQQTVGPLKLQAGGVSTVSDPVQLVEVGEVRVGPADAGRVRLEIGSSVTLAASILSTAGQAVTGRVVQWTSDAPNIARIDPTTGTVTAVALGVAHITAATPGGSGTVDVAVVPKPSAISIAPNGVTSGGGVVRSSPAGIDCRVIGGQAQGACTFMFPGDAKVTLDVTPDFAASFVGWGGACALSGASTSCVLDAAQARGATVSFSTQRQLSVSGLGAGTVLGAPGGIACQIATRSGTCDAGYADGAVVTLSATPGAQHTFAGWSGACSGTAPTCTVTMNADMAVGARFSTPLSLSVSGSGEGSGTIAGALTCSVHAGSSTPCGAEFPFGTIVTLTATPDPVSTFTGWSGACSGTGVCQVTMDQARAVTATFARRMVTVTLALAGPGAGAVNAGQGTCTLPAGASAASCEVKVPVGTPLTIVAAPALGSDFSAWSAACAGNFATSCAVTANSDLSIGARFVVTQVLVSVDVGAGATGGGRVTGGLGIDCTVGTASATGSCAGTASYGSTVTLVATPNATSTFVGWGGACRATSGKSCVLTPTDAASATATARFDEVRFPLVVTQSGSGGGTVASSPSGINCGSACTSTFVIGTPVTLTAVSDAGSQFSGWTGACAGSGPTCTVPVDAARNVTATFVSVYTLAVAVDADQGSAGHVTSNPVGFDCTDTCAQTFTAGTMVTLTATPVGTNSTFDGWTGACTGSGTTCTVTVSAARTVTARFSVTQFAIATTTVGTGAGAVASTPSGVTCPGACSASFNAGTMVTLKATPNATSTFVGWTGACAGASPTCTVTASAAQTVTAMFATTSTNPPVALNVLLGGTGTGTLTISGAANGQCPSECHYDIPTDGMVTLNASAAPGSTFTGWTGDCTSAGASKTCTLTMNRTHTITASFSSSTSTASPAGSYPLTIATTGTGTGTVTSTPAGVSCPSTCYGSYAANSSVTLAAHASVGSTFAGWAGACSGTGACIVAMTQARTVTAAFRK